MKAIGYAATTVTFIFINSVLSGLALSLLWAWFVVATFSLPELNIPTAIGLALIVSYLTHQNIKQESDGREFGEILFEGIIKGLMKPLWAILIGWIITLFL